MSQKDRHWLHKFAHKKDMNDKFYNNYDDLGSEENTEINQKEC